MPEFTLKAVLPRGSHKRGLKNTQTSPRGCSTRLCKAVPPKDAGAPQNTLSGGVPQGVGADRALWPSRSPPFPSCPCTPGPALGAEEPTVTKTSQAHSPTWRHRREDISTCERPGPGSFNCGISATLSGHCGQGAGLRLLLSQRPDGTVPALGPPADE